MKGKDTENNGLFSRFDVLIVVGLKSRCVETGERMHQEVTHNTAKLPAHRDHGADADSGGPLQPDQGGGGEGPPAGGPRQGGRAAAALLPGTRHDIHTTVVHNNDIQGQGLMPSLTRRASRQSSTCSQGSEGQGR